VKTLFSFATPRRVEMTLPDKDRPVNERGKRDAPKMGKRLAATFALQICKTCASDAALVPMAKAPDVH
jgi:phosphohistidine phosphatase SixA